MRDFRTLKVWEKSHQLALDVYGVTGKFPRGEQYGLTSQMRRAGVSIPSNIAEGCGRHGNAELTHFLNIAMGSASELQYQLLLSQDLGFLDENEYINLEGQVVEVKRMLTGFIQKLKAVH
jgi:four helix bundle protein